MGGSSHRTFSDRRLVEPLGMSAEGGEYASPVGTVERSEYGRVLQFQIRPEIASNISAFDIAALFALRYARRNI